MSVYGSGATASDGVAGRPPASASPSSPACSRSPGWSSSYTVPELLPGKSIGGGGSKGTTLFGGTPRKATKTPTPTPTPDAKGTATPQATETATPTVTADADRDAVRDRHRDALRRRRADDDGADLPSRRPLPRRRDA